MDLKTYIHSIKDWPRKGINFKDISPLLSNPEAFQLSIKGMSDLIKGKEVVLAGVDARGFIFASAIAQRLGLGILLLRKSGKLPPPKIIFEYELEYGSDQLEVKQAPKKSSAIVLVDDILATGGTISAACDLCLKAGYSIKQAIVLIDLIKIHSESFTLSNGISVDSLIKLE